MQKKNRQKWPFIQEADIDTHTETDTAQLIKSATAVKLSKWSLSVAESIRASEHIDAQFLVFSFTGLTLILIFVNFNFKSQPLTDWFSSPCFYMFALCWPEENCTAQFFSTFSILPMSTLFPFSLPFYIFCSAIFTQKQTRKCFCFYSCLFWWHHPLPFFASLSFRMPCRKYAPLFLFFG